MASLEPRLTDPDKLGLLIQCRMKMDQLNTDQLYNYAHLALKSLSMKQLKKLLFVGFNSIRKDVEYNQLFNMKSALNEIIENAKKIKKNKSKSKPKQKTKPKSTIPIIPKNASLTKTIPFDIISNNICPFLKMSSITNLARCDRQFAIICHSPTSIKNLMHRYDPYPYGYDVLDYEEVAIDGHYTNMESWTVSNIHKFKNVDKLSIKFAILDSLRLFNVFQKVKHLTFYNDPRDPDHEVGNIEKMKLMPLLQTISFVEFNDMWTLLHFLSPIETAHFNKIIHQLTSIAFVESVCNSLEDEEFDPDEYGELYEKYQNIANFILPSQPNRLQVLKFENSYFGKTIDPQCTDTNNEFANIEKIKTSLSNLKGFVFGHGLYARFSDDNLYFTLTTNILSNLILFSKLESIHTHSSTDQLIALYLNNNNTNALVKISELCISVTLESMNTSPFNTRSFKRFVPNLEKLCLVINISDNDKAYLPNFERVIKSILVNLAKLKVLQIVAIIEDEAGSDASFCIKKIIILTELTKVLVNSFIWIRKKSISKSNVKQQLLFKFHVKSYHSQRNANCKTNNNALELRAFVDSIQSLIFNYFASYPIGKLQFKLSWNISEHFWLADTLKTFMFGLDGLLRLYVKDCGCLIKEDEDYHLNDMDYKQYALSITKQNIDKNVEHENEWKVDCRYCCNTPWV